MMREVITSILVGLLISVPYAIFAWLVYGQPNWIAFASAFAIGFSVSFSPSASLIKSEADETDEVPPYIQGEEE